jgi:hypothetical protein
MNAGLDPDARVGPGRGMPAWCAYRQAARDEHVADEQRALADSIDVIYPAAQPEEYVVLLHVPNTRAYDVRLLMVADDKVAVFNSRVLAQEFIDTYPPRALFKQLPYQIVELEI